MIHKQFDCDKGREMEDTKISEARDYKLTHVYYLLREVAVISTGSTKDPPAQHGSHHGRHDQSILH